MINIKATGGAIIILRNAELADGAFVQLFDSTFVWTAEEGDGLGQPRAGLCCGMGRVTPKGV